MATKTSSSRRPSAVLRPAWTPPAVAAHDLRFNMGESVLVQFVAAHDPPAVLRELVQNEYDAGGRTLEVVFGVNSLRVRGTGETINAAGWKRLSLMLGTGRVHATGEHVHEKVNGIGSKNFGLRSLFLFGDRIYVRSGGKQIFLDRLHGTPAVLDDPSSRGLPGVQIEVPYRETRDGLLQPFGIEQETAALEALATQLAPTLVKLAQPGRRRSLEKIVVRSERLGRRLAWHQAVATHRCRVGGIQVLHRVVRLTDSNRNRPQRFEELEFQQAFDRPMEHSGESIPGYFARGKKVMIGVSVRMRNGALDDTHPGTWFYPLGVPQGFTGTAVSVSAPFVMDGDRSRLMDGSPWNAWLIDRAVELTTTLLTGDWVDRFGAGAFHALAKIAPASPVNYLDAARKHLTTAECWPSRKRDGSGPVFVRAGHLVVADGPELDGFIMDPSRDPDERIAADPVLRKTLLACKAQRFSLASLVRLRCAGDPPAGLQTKLEKRADEVLANFHYNNFPGALANAALQSRFSRAFDAHAKRLSPDNWKDLRRSATTLTGAGTLAPAESLWAVPEEFYSVADIPPKDRLHPALVAGRVIGGIAKVFHPNKWAREVAERVRAGKAGEAEREALYRYVVSRGEDLPSKLRAYLRESKVLRDHAGAWGRPADIIPRRTAGADALAPVLHFPHADYSRKRRLARALGFRERVGAGDLVAYAELVEQEPERAPSFERILRNWRRTLPPQALRALRELQWCRTTAGPVLAPEETYLDTPQNRACLGPDAPYAAAELGEAVLRRLGCRDEPNWQDIVAHLGRLRVAGAPLDTPERVYRALVDALRSSRLTPLTLSNHAIVWTGREWSTPAETLVGPTYARFFAGVVPLIRNAPVPVTEAMLAFGASRTPSARHWRAILDHVARTYPTAGTVVRPAEADRLRAAYAHLKGKLADLAPDARVFLDRAGRLHSTREVAAYRYLIDDDPEMAAAVAATGHPIAFAVEDVAALPFLFEQGVSTLRKARTLVGHRVGVAYDPPEFLEVPARLKRLHDPVFASALAAYLAAFSRRRGERGDDRTRLIEGRLRVITSLVMVRDLRVEYRIAGRSVLVKSRFAVERERALFADVRKKADLMDLLSRAVAEIVTGDPKNALEIADPIYRLLGCNDAEEMEQYLTRGGVPWSAKAASSRSRRLDEEEEHAPASAPMQQVLGDVLTRTLGGTPRPGPAPGAPPTRQAAAAPPKSTPAKALPPLDKLRPVQSNVTPGWRPGKSAGGGTRGSGGSGWTPPSQADLERDRALGRRGEEIVLGLERARVRAAGHNEGLVTWVAAADEGADHDIRSIDDDGARVWIEVKATTGRTGRFQWSRAEFELALRERTRYILYRVYEADGEAPIVKRFRDPIGMLTEDGIRLDIANLNAEVEPARIG